MDFLSEYQECYFSECYSDLTQSLRLVPKKLIENKNRLMEEFREKQIKNKELSEDLFSNWKSLKLVDLPPIKVFKKPHFGTRYDSAQINLHY